MVTKSNLFVGSGLVLALVACGLLAMITPALAQSPDPVPPFGAIQLPAAPKQAKPVAGTPVWDGLVANSAKSIGWTDYAYDAWQLPATTTWYDTFKYYTNQFTQAGWNGHSRTEDIPGGRLTIWISADAKSAVMVIFIPSSDGAQPVYNLTVTGR